MGRPLQTLPWDDITYVKPVLGFMILEHESCIIVIADLLNFVVAFYDVIAYIKS